MARTKQTKRGKKSNDKKPFGAPKRHRKGKKEDVWDPKKTRESYVEAVRESETFEAYYKAQTIIPPEEWDLFMKTMKADLPTAFRVTGSKAEAKSLLSIVESQFFKDLVNADTGEENAEAVKPICLPWYPNRLAWQLQLTRKAIRSSEAFFKLHNFLISETSSGCISRQETVSMIPPILMDVKPHHKVLDMCAAPGSKTAQLIEMLHAEDSETGKLPEGLLVANDVDNSRCYMLVHQAKRLNSPCITIINHDASALPNMVTTNPDGSKSILKFDRILCDVPCSGDGTLRKNPDIWLKWNAANGNNMHGIQYRVARRGLEMLAVGGRLVYSTCSLNPVEDEAVVSRLIKDSEGAVQLVDVTESVPGLVHSKGVTKWSICARNLKIYDKYEDVPQEFHTQIRSTLFPLPEEEISKQHLERCIRILPHHQNTGGFFVAVLEKVKLTPWESQKLATELAVKTENAGNGEEETEGEKPQRSRSPQRKKRRIQGYKEDPFVFFTEEEELWPQIRDLYDIKPELSPTCFLTRCKIGKKKNIYFTSPAVRDLVANNEDHIKLINTGLKAFARCDNKGMECPFRLAQEGLNSIVNFLGPKRRVEVTREDFILLLTNDDPRFPPEITKFSEPVQERLNKMEPQGSLVVELKDSELSLSVVGWKGARSLRAYVAVPECVHMLRLLGADISKYEKNKFKNKAPREGKGEEGEDEGNGDVVKKEPEDDEESLEDELMSEVKKEKEDEDDDDEDEAMPEKPVEDDIGETPIKKEDSEA